MGYDPFVRGSAAVGVTTIELHDPSLGRASVPMELSCPAIEAYRGCDFDDANRDRFRIAPGLPETAQHAVRNATAAPEVFPLFMYFHGGYGDRRECTHLCTHLASHGYLVAAASFPGDSITDLMPSGDGSHGNGRANADRRVGKETARTSVGLYRASPFGKAADRRAYRSGQDRNRRLLDRWIHSARGEFDQSKAIGYVCDVSDVRRAKHGPAGPPPSGAPSCRQLGASSGDLCSQRRT